MACGRRAGSGEVSAGEKAALALVRCVPRLRWMPEHWKQMNVPRLMDAHAFWATVKMQEHAEKKMERGVREGRDIRRVFFSAPGASAVSISSLWRAHAWLGNLRRQCSPAAL